MKDTLSLLLIKDVGPETLEESVVEVKRLCKESIPLNKEANKLLNNTAYSVLQRVEIPLLTSFPETAISFITQIECKDKLTTAIVYLKAALKEVPDPDTKFPDPFLVSYAAVSTIFIGRKSYIFDHEEYYDFAIDMMNQFIESYKLLPGKHNHDLRKINTTNSGFVIKVDQFKLRKNKPKYVDSIGLHLNAGFYSSMTNFAIEDSELIDIVNGIIDPGSVQKLIREPLIRLIKAYDANCYADTDSVLVLASSAIEGFFMQLQAGIRMAQGEELEGVINEIESNSLKELTRYLSQELNLSTSKKSIYKAWYRDCYLKRNRYLHRQNSFDVFESRKAIDSSTRLIEEVSKLLRQNKPDSSELCDYLDKLTYGLLNMQIDENLIKQ